MQIVVKLLLPLTTEFNLMQFLHEKLALFAASIKKYDFTLGVW